MTQTKMERCAADLLEEIFKAMPEDPTVDELDIELKVAMHALQNVEARANQMRPHGTPRLFLRPTGLLLQALTNQFHKDDSTTVFKVGE